MLRDRRIVLDVDFPGVCLEVRWGLGCLFFSVGLIPVWARAIS